jgi:PTS system nitrogen regulatory IIA component
MVFRDGAAMKIEDFLSPADIVIDARASDKDALLRDLCSHAAARLNLDSDLVAEEILKREELGSSGTGSGIAIPHARIPDVERPSGVLARLRKAVAFDAIDGNPVDIAVLLLLPASADGKQINSLACAARSLRDLETVRGIRREEDRAEIYRTLIAASAKK